MRLSINGVWWHALAPSVGMSSNARLRAAVGGTPPVQGLVGQTVRLNEKIRKSLNRLYKDLYFHPEREGLCSSPSILRKVLVLLRLFDSISLSDSSPPNLGNRTKPFSRKTPQDDLESWPKAAVFMWATFYRP